MTKVGKWFGFRCSFMAASCIRYCLVARLFLFPLSFRARALIYRGCCIVCNQSPMQPSYGSHLLCRNQSFLDDGLPLCVTLTWKLKSARRIQCPPEARQEADVGQQDAFVLVVADNLQCHPMLGCPLLYHLTHSCSCAFSSTLSKMKSWMLP